MPDDDDDDLDTGLLLMLDTNCINAKQGNAALNQLEEWAGAGYIDLIMCETSHQESYADGNALRRRKACTHIQSISHAETPEEQRQLQAIGRAAFPLGQRHPGSRTTSTSSSTP